VTEEAEIRIDGAARRAPSVVARGLPSVLWRTVRLLCGGGVTGAALPVLACYAAFQFVLVVAGVLAVGEDGSIVNDEIRTYEWTPRIVAYAFAAVPTLLAAHVAAVAAVVLIAAGRLLDRPVAARSAARVVARRAPALAASVPLTGGALLAVPAAGAGVYLLTGELWVGFFACAVAGLMSCWSVLAVPLIVLEGAGPAQAMARAWTLTRHRRARCSWSVLGSVLVVPGAVAAGGWALAWPLGEDAHAIAVRVTITAADALAVLLQGAGLAVVTLSRRYPDAAVERERRRPAPRRTAALLTLVIAAPGLVYWAVLRTDPYDWVMVSDHVVEHAAGRDVLLLPEHGAPAVLASRRDTGFDLRVCDGPTCRSSRLAGHVPYVEDRVDAAVLPSGSLVVAGWQYGLRRAGKSGEQPLLLKLIACTARGCPDMPAAPTTLRASWRGLAASVAVAASGSQVVVAVAAPLWEKDAGDGAASTLRVMRCANLPCGDPAVLVSVPVPQAIGVADKPLALALGRAGRPVAAYEDLDSGELTVVSCADAACRRSRATPLVPRRSFTIEQKEAIGAGRHAGSAVSNAYPDAVEIVVPPDDRPVLAYRDLLTGAARLLRCRDRDCTSADTSVLGPPSRAQQAPALALGPDGLPLVAVHDLTDASVTLIACRDPACARRDKARIGTYTDIPGPMDLGVGRDGRPRILWVGRTAGRTRSEAHLTTCRRPRCAPGGAAFWTSR
jgi:hypothetical protein